MTIPASVSPARPAAIDRSRHGPEPPGSSSVHGSLEGLDGRRTSRGSLRLAEVRPGRFPAERDAVLTVGGQGMPPIRVKHFAGQPSAHVRPWGHGSDGQRDADQDAVPESGPMGPRQRGKYRTEHERTPRSSAVAKESRRRCSGVACSGRSASSAIRASSVRPAVAVTTIVDGVGPVRRFCPLRCRNRLTGQCRPSCRAPSRAFTSTIAAMTIASSGSPHRHGHSAGPRRKQRHRLSDLTSENLKRAGGRPLRKGIRPFCG